MGIPGSFPVPRTPTLGAKFQQCGTYSGYVISVRYVYGSDSTHFLGLKPCFPSGLMRMAVP